MTYYPVNSAGHGKACVLQADLRRSGSGSLQEIFGRSFPLDARRTATGTMKHATENAVETISRAQESRTTDLHEFHTCRFRVDLACESSEELAWESSCELTSWPSLPLGAEDKPILTNVWRDM